MRSAIPVHRSPIALARRRGLAGRRARLSAAPLAVALVLLAPSAAGAAPDFTVSPPSPLVDEPVTFTPTGTRGRLQWDLDFDRARGFEPDVETRGGASIRYAYRSAGSRSVAIREGRGSSPPAAVHTVVVRALTFGWAPGTPLSFERVTFLAATESRSTLTGYRWDLDGDGEYDDATGRSVRWTFWAPGSYRVGLEVVANGRLVMASRTVSVRNRPPTAALRVSPASPLIGELVEFTSLARDLDGAIASEAWDLDGDGRFDDGDGTTVSHRYSSAGSRTVILRVTDSHGASANAFASVDVRSPGSRAPSGRRGADLPRRTPPTPDPSPPSTGQQGAAPPAPPLRFRPPLRLIGPYTVVRIAGSFSRRGARVRYLGVRAPRYSRVTVRCRGRSCPYRRASRRVGRSRRVRFKKLERFLRAGTRIEIFVVRRGRIGKYTGFRIRAGRAPARRDRCVMPGSTRPRSCPSD